MSKIQKAIHKIEKLKSAEQENAPMLPLGKVVSERVARGDLGDVTQRLATIDESKLQYRIAIDREALGRAGFIAPEDEERV